MNQRTRGAVAAFVAMVAISSTASAESTAGKGSLGAILGVPYFLSDSDTKDGQRPRILGQGHFQYAFSERTRLSTSFGYGWVGYKAGTPAPYKLVDPATGDSVLVKDEVLTKFQPIAVSILHAFKPQGEGWVPYLGVGANLTRIEIVNDRRKIKDPATFESYVNWAPGVQAQLGMEHFLSANEHVSFDWNVRYSKLFSKDEKKFPSGFTGSHSYVTANFGVNVYFWPIGHRPIEIAKDPAKEAAPPPTTEAPEAPPEPEAPPTPEPVPTPPDTTAAPDTTRAPGTQSSILSRGGARSTTVAAPAGRAGTTAPTAASPSAAEPEETCPVRPTSDVTSGMFGVPGTPVVPPHGTAPPSHGGEGASHDRHPEGGPTP